jgi:hypothetical protein
MSDMRNIAVALSAALVFAMVAPAFAQPFADVPTNHWAYDAIAELAAKGIVEGFPDGTFRGDRAMTRFEMAMIVARLLARIESIQVPAPTPAAPGGPMVTPENLQQVQRLVNEFRAELAALGVRVTAVEEELNALKAKQSNVRFTGAYRYRYDNNQPGSGTAAGQDPRIHTSSAGAAVPNNYQYVKLSFDGSVDPNVHLIGALIENAGASFNSGVVGPTTAESLGAIDNMFFDWKNGFGWPIEVWLGRFGGDCCGTSYPVQFGPFGLLFNSGGDTWEDSANDTGWNVVDGLRIMGHWPAWADLQAQAVYARIIGGAGGTYFSGEDAYGVDANVQLIAGLRVGAYYVANSITGSPAQPAAVTLGSFYHDYGPGGGGINPSTSHCPPTANGIQCPALGNGWGGYADYTAFPGITLDGEYASWTDGVLGGSDNGWKINVTWDLGTLTGVGHNFSLQTAYEDYGQNFYPPYGAAEADISLNCDCIYPGNAQGWVALLSFDPWQGITLYGDYFSGNNIGGTVSGAASLSEWQAGVIFKFAPNTQLNVFANAVTFAGVQQYLLYRAQMDYTF